MVNLIGLRTAKSFGNSVCIRFNVYLKPKVTLHFSIFNISILVLILSKLNIAMSSKHLSYHHS